MLLFAGLVSLLTTVLFGLAPAFQAAKRDVTLALRGESGAMGGPGRRVHLRDLLVVGQLALSLVLLVAGALLVRGLVQGHRMSPGFDPDRIAVLSFNLKLNGYSEEQATAFQRRLVERLRAVPGAGEVALVSRPPLDADVNMEGIRIPGHHLSDGEPTPVDATYVEPDYFAVLGLEARDGRLLTEADGPGAPGVVVVNEAMARRYWPGRSAGRRADLHRGVRRPVLRGGGGGARLQGPRAG